MRFGRSASLCLSCTPLKIKLILEERWEFDTFKERECHGPLSCHMIVSYLETVHTMNRFPRCRTSYMSSFIYEWRCCLCWELDDDTDIRVQGD
uniref:Uncharacterized protein n=1 Tax=Physcomitrium patens TaxID=3218 RepID=A0A2K1JRN0_PHYPA|nr:hypothetical protein PHYPA_016571 [Physcomitrium patens]